MYHTFSLQAEGVVQQRHAQVLTAPARTIASSVVVVVGQLAGPPGQSSQPTLVVLRLGPIQELLTHSDADETLDLVARLVLRYDAVVLQFAQVVA